MRRVFVYVKMETTMDLLKVGDIMSFEPADESDMNCPSALSRFMVEEPAVSEGNGHFSIRVSHLAKDPNFGKVN